MNAVAAEACTATGRRTVALADGLVADTAVPLIVVLAEIACIMYVKSNKILLIINDGLHGPIKLRNVQGWRGYDPSYPRSKCTCMWAAGIPYHYVVMHHIAYAENSFSLHWFSLRYGSLI